MFLTNVTHLQFDLFHACLNETFHRLFRLLASQLGNLCLVETTFRFDQEELSYAIRIPVCEFYAEV